MEGLDLIVGNQGDADNRKKGETEKKLCKGCWQEKKEKKSETDKAYQGLLQTFTNPFGLITFYEHSIGPDNTSHEQLLPDKASYQQVFCPMTHPINNPFLPDSTSINILFAW